MHSIDRPRFGLATALALLVALTACGGGGGGAEGSGGAAPADAGTAPPVLQQPATRADAARLLTQATFGPNDADIDAVMALGWAGWVDQQLSLPLPGTSHRAWWEAADAAIKATAPTSAAGQDPILESFWNHALHGPDQLRQRVAFALSQLFVVSAVDDTIGNQPRALAAWLDMLNARAFGSYRDLLEAVTLHPLMGSYLTHLKNQKANAASGRVPDQNYAREVMQLFSIGLVRLNPDGSPVLVDGKPVETYGSDDVVGLSRVFTGFSWACPGAPASNNCFSNGSTGGSASQADPDRWIKNMVGYPQHHSTEAKSFLGVTVAAQTTADPAASLRVALDTLAAHPNVGPFIGRQLIQRLVTSNPSPAYVQAVAAAFDNNGAGTRGDLKAVVRAVLLHPEARLAAGTQGGKLREPVLRLSAYLRAFPHTSDSGSWKVGNTDNAASSLGQTPLRAPSVFNFYRPGWMAPGTRTAAAGLVAPELQLLNETSAAGWVNAMRDNLASGVGQTNGTVNGVVRNRRDLQRDWTRELALAGTPADLVAAVATRLLHGPASPALLTDITAAVGSIAVPALNASASNQSSVDAAKRNRVNAALLLVLATPEFLLQK